MPYRKRGILIVLFIIIVIAILTLYGYFYPSSQVTKIFSYYNKISSLILVILTTAYVFTTNRQLISMKKQLEVMDKSVNLQVQPLLVPSLEDVFLNKISAYFSPADKELHIEYHFQASIIFNNGGNSTVLVPLHNVQR